MSNIALFSQQSVNQSVNQVKHRPIRCSWIRGAAIGYWWQCGNYVTW